MELEIEMQLQTLICLTARSGVRLLNREIAVRRIFINANGDEKSSSSFRELGEWDSNQNQWIFNQKSQFQPPIGPPSSFVQSAKKPKNARQACQAVRFRVMGGSGPVPNRLPLDFGVKIIRI